MMEPGKGTHPETSKPRGGSSHRKAKDLHSAKLAVFSIHCPAASVVRHRKKAPDKYRIQGPAVPVCGNQDGIQDPSICQPWLLEIMGKSVSLLVPSFSTSQSCGAFLYPGPGGVRGASNLGAMSMVKMPTRSEADKDLVCLLALSTFKKPGDACF